METIKVCINLLKQLKKPIKIIIAIAILVEVMALCMIGWNIVRLYSLRSSLQDVYFMEYGDGGTTIHKYDVDRRKTVTVAVLEGGRYSHCKINRTENYIIGEFWRYKEDTDVLLRYNLSNDTTEEITGKEAEIIEQRIKEAEDKLPKRSDLPEKVRKIVSNKFICWSANRDIAAFGDGNQKNIYTYNVNTETCECVIKAGWNQTFSPNLGLDASGRYIFYKNNFNYLFQTADVKIMLYDTQTGRRKKIFGRRYTQNIFEFVQEMD